MFKYLFVRKLVICNFKKKSEYFISLTQLKLLMFYGIYSLEKEKKKLSFKLEFNLSNVIPSEIYFQNLSPKKS